MKGVIALLGLSCTLPMSAHTAEPAQMRPMLIQGTWQFVGRFHVTDKGIVADDLDLERNERVHISRNMMHVFRPGKDKPTEIFEMKIKRFVNDGIGILEFEDKKNGLPTLTMLYRFEGRRLLLCLSEDLESKPGGFAAKGTKILELIPYESDRLIASFRRFEPKTDTFRDSNPNK